MTQEEALEVKDLAKPVIEALGVVTERECSWCQGKGQAECWVGGLPRFSPARKRNEICDPCSGTGKLSWKWEPKVGEWCIYGKYVELISAEDIENHNCIHLFHVWADVVDCIPILHWEELERVLEGTGYELDLVHTSYRNSKEEHNIEIARKDDADPTVWNCKGKSRQEAVMRSVIALGKKLREEIGGSREKI